MPKVSVLMPVYNTKEEYLRVAIESILAQTFSDFEFLILNDASTDENVEKVVKSYNDKRIKYYKNEKNLGISPTRNKLIDMARGEYLAIMDHDDMSMPERLAEQTAYLDAHPDVGVVGCWPGVIGNDGYVNKLPVDDTEIRETLMLIYCICHPAAMVRKSVLTENNIYYEACYTPAEDYSLWCRLISKTKFANLPKVLFKYRFHDTNTSKLQSEKISEASIRVRCFARLENPELWASVQQRMQTITKVKLFNFSVLTTEEGYHYKKCKLFGCIPLYSYGQRIVCPWLKYFKKIPY